MKNEKIIIAVLVIAVLALACILGAMLMPSLNAKNDSKITIASNDTLYEGDKLAVKLTDLNGTPIVGGDVNVTVFDGDGKVVFDKSVKTNSKGKASMSMGLDPGNYTVNATFCGNDNYTTNSTSKKITIEEEIIEEPVEETYNQESTSSSDVSSSSQDRPAVDSGGVTREEADYWGWEYTPEHGGHYHGSRDRWDEEAGMYHD